MTAPVIQTPAEGAEPSFSSTRPQRHALGGHTPRRPYDGAPRTVPIGAARSPRPQGATERRALDAGEYVVYSASGEATVRCADPNDAERFRIALKGTVRHVAKVTAA